MIYFTAENNWTLWVLGLFPSRGIHKFLDIPPFKRWAPVLLPLNMDWTQ